MKTDIQIAREARLDNIASIAKKVGIDEEKLIPYGKYIAKLPYTCIDDEKVKKSNLILVTAITPTKAGIGKTTVSIGLALGMNKRGKKTAVALREPSLGPCFGMKGGAAGGGYAQVLPMEDINLHFTGDFHAITSAHNMISALFDNYIFRNQGTPKAIKKVLWKRVLDVNDRNLRQVVTGLGDGNGVVMESGFDITPASEIMAVFCLSKDIEDLRRRIEQIILGFDSEGNSVTVKDLGIAGSIVVLLKNAINPNLVQTIEHTPAFIHGGPFANIAHGCSSVIATKMAMTYCDYVITEAGFAAELGAEKFFDIKCRKAGLCPKLTVIAATTGALKMHGGVAEKEISKPNKDALVKGLENLDAHIANMKKFGQSVVVGLNRYGYDSDEEIELLRKHCKEIGVGFAVNNAFVEGGEGALELADLVVKMIAEEPSNPLNFVYEENDAIKTKIEKICKNIYGAREVTYSVAAAKMIKKIEEQGFSSYPVCIAKTQYSFSSDPALYGVPKDFEMNVRDVVLNSGSEMIVAVMGDMMRMPGLPKDPQAIHIDLVNGEVEGLS